MVNHILNRVSLTPWSRVLENLIVAQLTKKFSTLGRTPKFITQWDLRFSRQWLWRLMSSNNFPRIVLYICTYDSEKLAVSIFMADDEVPPNCWCRSPKQHSITAHETVIFSVYYTLLDYSKVPGYRTVSWASSHLQTLFPRDVLKNKFLLLKTTPTDNYFRHSNHYFKYA
jgi:hypothetical protein